MPQYYADFPSGLTNYAELPNDTTIIIANQVDIRVKVASAQIGLQIRYIRFLLKRAVQ